MSLPDAVESDVVVERAEEVAVPQEAVPVPEATAEPQEAVAEQSDVAEVHEQHEAAPIEAAAEAEAVPPSPEEQVDPPAAETPVVDIAVAAPQENTDGALDETARAAPTPAEEAPAPTPTSAPAPAAVTAAEEEEPTEPAARPSSHSKKVAFAQPEAAVPRSAKSPRQRSAPRTAVPASPPRVDVAPAAASADGPPHATNTDASDVYTRAETERIAAAAAALTPNTVLGLFRRGKDNSHTNRMEAGSYSRYLLSTDHMPPIVLSETFHGEQPTLGTVPRNTLKRSVTNHDEREGGGASTTGEVPPQDSRGAAAAASASSHSEQRTRRSSSAASAAAQGLAAMNTTFSSTTGSGTLRREVEMLDAHTFADLDEARSLRRHDPRKGKPAPPQLDYVYYNHKSKGYYVPHDPSPNTTMLQYNHMYDFGDGTRFAPLATSAAGAAGTQRSNPHAAPPRTFAETRGCTFSLTASQRMRTAHSAPAGGAASGSRSRTPQYTPAVGEEAEVARQQQQRRRQRAEIQNGTSSLRTAKSIDVARLHRTQCPRPRTIEEVLADKQQGYLTTVSMSGATHPLVRDIRQGVSSGKLEWAEVPAALQDAIAVAGQRTAYASAQSRPSYPRDVSSGQPQRAASLAQPANGLVDVMGHLRQVPAIAAATATRRSLNATSPLVDAAGEEGFSAEPYPGAAAAQSGRAAKSGGGGGHAAAAGTASPLPVISRLNYARS